MKLIHEIDLLLTLGNEKVNKESELHMDYNELMRKAVKNLAKLETGQIFYVKDLFEGYFWNNLPKNDRLGFGKHFKNQVDSKRITCVSYAGKAKNNSAQYRFEGIEGETIDSWNV